MHGMLSATGCDGANRRKYDGERMPMPCGVGGAERIVIAMRIALYSEVFTPDTNGVATHMKTLKDGLEKAGHDVLVVTADKHARRHRIGGDNVLRCPAIRLKRVYGFGIGMPASRRRFELAQAFAPDIIHIQSEFSIGLSGVIAARKLNLPLVYTVHTMYDDAYVQYVVPRPFVRIAKRLLYKHVRCLARRATAVIVPSKRARRFLREDIRAEGDAFIPIPNAIAWHSFDPNRFSATDKAQLCNRLHTSPAKRTAVYVGRLGKEKSMDVLLAWWAEAMKPEDNWQLVIVGDGPEAENLRAQAETLGIASMVAFAGAVENEEVGRYLAIGDVFMTASLSENNSISMLEAMASGLMVLERYDEGTADQIAVGINGDFFADSSQMGEKLRKAGALDDKALIEQKRRVRDSVKHLDTAEMVQKTLGAYRKAIAAHQQKPELELAHASQRARRHPHTDTNGA